MPGILRPRKSSAESINGFSFERNLRNCSRQRGRRRSSASSAPRASRNRRSCCRAARRRAARVSAAAATDDRHLDGVLEEQRVLQRIAVERRDGRLVPSGSGTAAIEPSISSGAGLSMPRRVAEEVARAERQLVIAAHHLRPAAVDESSP